MPSVAPEYIYRDKKQILAKAAVLHAAVPKHFNFAAKESDKGKLTVTIAQSVERTRANQDVAG